MLPGCQREGDDGVRQPDALGRGAGRLRQRDFHAVHIGAPAVLVGNGCVEQAVLCGVHRAGQARVRVLRHVPDAPGQAGKSLVEHGVVLLGHVQRDRALLTLGNGVGQGDGVARIEAAEAEQAADLDIAREQPLAVAVDGQVIVAGRLRRGDEQAVLRHDIGDAQLALPVSVLRGIAVLRAARAAGAQIAGVRRFERVIFQVGVERVVQPRGHAEHFLLLLDGVIDVLLRHKAAQRTVRHKAEAEIGAVLQQQDIAGLRGDGRVGRVALLAVAVNEVFKAAYQIRERAALIIEVAVARGPRGQTERTAEAVEADVCRRGEDGNTTVAVERGVIERLVGRDLHAAAALGYGLQDGLHVRFLPRIG